MFLGRKKCDDKIEHNTYSMVDRMRNERQKQEKLKHD